MTRLALTMAVGVIAAAMLPLSFGGPAEATGDEPVYQWYRSVAATGVATGDATLSLSGTGTPLVTVGAAEDFTYNSEFAILCDGTRISSHSFTVAGEINGAGGYDGGVWNFLGLNFLGPGGPGLQDVPVSGPFVVSAYPGLGGDEALTGALALDYQAGGGAAGGSAIHETYDCDSQTERTITDLDLSGVCLVTGSYYWADTDPRLSTTGHPFVIDTEFEEMDTSGATTVHYAQLYDCKETLEPRFQINPSMYIIPIDQ